MSNSDPKPTKSSTVAPQKQAQPEREPMILPRGKAEKPSKEAEIVTQVTKFADEATQIERFERAKEATHKLDGRLVAGRERAKTDRKEAEAEGHVAIREMMRLAECFPRPDGSIDLTALKAFLKKQTGTEHGGVDNEWQRLAKHCSLPKTPSGIVTKRGYVLAAVFAERISSEKIIDKFGVLEDVGEHKQKSGMRKYILKYHQMNAKPLTAEEEHEKFIQGTFGNWSMVEYKEAAEYFLKELDGYGLIDPKIDYTKILKV